MLVSVLLPTRNRLVWLQESIDSIFANAAHPDQVEVLLAMDDDDTATQEQLAPYLTRYPTVRLFSYPRAGYVGLHIYMNAIAKEAKGDYFLLWNDDARMKTAGWDQILQDAIAKSPFPLVYQLQNNHGEDIFAIVPRAWYEITGHISLVAPYDSWVNDIANTLEVNTPIQIYGYHLLEERKTTPGYEPIPQEAYQQGQVQLYSDAAMQQRMKDTAKLSCCLYSTRE